MVNDNKKKETRFKKPMSTPTTVFWIGLFGGVFWTFIGYLAYLFSFTEIRPNIVLEPWAIGDWKKGWLGTMIAFFIIALFSIGAAFIYYGLLKKLKGIWPGIGYGIVLFLVVFIILNPLFPSMDPFLKLKRDTFITSACLFIIYGIFIGYSIGYDWQNQKIQEDEPVS